MIHSKADLTIHHMHTGSRFSDLYLNMNSLRHLLSNQVMAYDVNKWYMQMSWPQQDCWKRDADWLATKVTRQWPHTGCCQIYCRSVSQRRGISLSNYPPDWDCHTSGRCVQTLFYLKTSEIAKNQHPIR